MNKGGDSSVPLRWCPIHARAWVPQGTATRAPQGHIYAARPAQWAPFSPTIISLAQAWARAFQMGGLITIEETACDQCGEHQEESI